MRKFKFVKVAGDDDVRDVLVNGKLIGRIHHAWNRLGGWGWSHAVVGQTHRSMADAADALLQKQRRKPPY